MGIAEMRLLMSFHAPAQALAPSRHPAQIWNQIEQGVRESCVMRCEGREPEAAAMLQETLPPLIREWSAQSGGTPDECRQALRQLFTRAQEQVAAAMLSRRLVLASIRPGEVGAAAGGTLYLRRRIPLDDVPDMLDALQESERTAIRRGQDFPNLTPRPFAALAAG